MGKTILEMIVEVLKTDQWEYADKELLLCKFEYANSIQDAYLTDEEKAEVNKILAHKGIKFKMT